MKFNATIMTICIHPETESPVLANHVTTISLADEDAGVFLVLEQDGNKIRIDPDELQLLLEAGNTLTNQKGIM